MRSVFLIIALLVVAIKAGSAEAYTNGSLNEYCNKLANVNYNVTALSGNDKIEATLCMTYMAAVIDAAERICHVVTEDEVLMLMFASSATRSDLKTVIQAFLTWAKQNPHQADMTPMYAVWLSGTHPCQQ